MGKKYRILICGNEAGRVEHNDIVELEEIQDEKKETLEDKFKKYCRRERYTISTSDYDAEKLEHIAKTHYQSHPEELGLVRLEDVLKVFTDAWFGWRNDPNSSTTLFVYIKEAIEGMKG